MDDLLVVSTVVLWILVLVLTASVWALTRQVGVLYRRITPAGALAVNEQLLAGEAAPRVEVETLDAQPLLVGEARDDGRGLLLFFLDPTCPICKALLPVLEAVAPDPRRLHVVLASDGSTVAAHRRFVETEGLQRYPYVVSELLGRSYGVGKVPYAVLIDPLGRIAALGIVDSREHLESLVDSWEPQVGFRQDHRARVGGEGQAFHDAVLPGDAQSP